MMALTHGNLEGRAMILETATEDLRALFAVVKLGIYTEWDLAQNDQQTELLLFVRLGKTLCDRLDQTAKEIRQLAAHALRQEQEAQRAETQGKGGQRYH